MATVDNFLPFKGQQTCPISVVDPFKNLNLTDNVCYLEEIFNPKTVSEYQRSNNLSHCNDLKAKKDINLWNKSNKHLSTTFLNLNRNFEENNKINRKEKSANSSTLSLHIAAYENSIEVKNDSDAMEKKGESSYFIKKWRTLKDSSTTIIQNPFEFPRQEHTQAQTSMPFSASQTLLNPNQMNLTSDPTNNLSTMEYVMSKATSVISSLIGNQEDIKLTDNVEEQLSDSETSMAHKVPLAPSESSTSLSNNLSVLGIQDSSTVDSSELNSSKTEIKQEGLLKEEVVSSPGYLSKPQGVKRRLCKDPIGGSVKKVEKDLADMEEIIRGNKKPKNICLCFKGPASLRKVTTSRGSVLNLTLLDKFGRSVEAVVWPPESTIIEQKLQAFEEDIALEASNDLWVSFPKQPFVFADILHKLNFGPKVIFRCYQLPAGYAASFTKSTPLDLFDLRKKILYHTYKFKIDSMDILEVLSHPKPLSDDLNAVVVGNTDSLAFMKFPKSIEASSMIKFGGNITLKGVHISYDANEIDVDKYWNLFYEESSETKPSHILIISATRSSSIFETDEAATYFVESVSELKHVTPLFLNETFT